MKNLRRNTFVLMMLAIMLLMLNGCATLSDAQKARGSGTSKVYAASFETVWSAMPSVISTVGLQNVEANKKDRYMLAQRGVTALSYGENVAVFIEPVGKKQTKVEIVTKRTWAPSVFAPDWAEPIFAELDKKFKRP
jgi:hypothetical protein